MSDNRKRDLTGERLGHLQVLYETDRSHDGKIMWQCRCDCGNYKEISSSELIGNSKKSCGCRSKESHGMEGTKVYMAWKGMKNRCFNPNEPHYKNYGGRGITVCDRWKNSFINFYEDMGDKPSADHSLDRIDVNGNYEPCNCQWTDKETQIKNRRNTIWITYDNRTQTAIEWSRELGISEKIFHHRKRAGYSDEETILGIYGDLIKCPVVYNVETWRRANIKGFDQFLLVSSEGGAYVEPRVSSGRNWKGRYLEFNSGIYYNVNIRHNGEQYSETLHRLVAAAFIDPEGRFQDMVVHHIDGNKHNNKVDNLCYCTITHNNLMKYDHNKNLFTNFY